MKAFHTGFYLGLPARLDHFGLPRFVPISLTTLLVASGAGSLNQYIERDFDAQMRRTRRRSLTTGRMQPSSALWFETVSAQKWAQLPIFEGFSAPPDCSKLLILWWTR
jgi:heme O synthase-like polyprenyltransferase